MRAFAPPNTFISLQDRARSMAILSPAASDEFSVAVFPLPIDIVRLYAVVRGSTPSATWTIRYGTDRSAVGTEVVTGGTVTTSEAGDTISTFDSPNIPIDSYMWLEIIAISGTVDELFVGFVFDES